jgi:hypothetical protein
MMTCEHSKSNLGEKEWGVRERRGWEREEGEKEKRVRGSGVRGKIQMCHSRVCRITAKIFPCIFTRIPFLNFDQIHLQKRKYLSDIINNKQKIDTPQFCEFFQYVPFVALNKSMRACPKNNNISWVKKIWGK